MKKKKQVNVKLDDRLYQHLAAIAKVRSVVEGRLVRVPEVFRDAASRHYGYFDFSLTCAANPPVVKELLEGGR